jgi:flagellar protein FliO/FliZ
MKRPGTTRGRDRRLMALLASGAALAGGATPLAIAAETASPPPGPDLLPTTLGLALVLALIFGAAWLVRRIGLLGRGGSGLLRVVASQAVGQRERVVVLEVGEQWLVLGVAPGRVNALQTLPRGTTPEIAAALPTFAALLARATGKAAS